MNKIENTIKSFLQKYDLEKSDLVYLVAFSGGFDSMCLLHALKKICKNKIVAIHLNHKWRGEESDREELNCQNFCKNLGIDFYSEVLDENIPHTETAARDARYKFFEKCSKKFSSKIVFTAHNKNDNAETLIYRICMGTGISGLQGISAHRDIYYRPLLSVLRDEIEKYSQKLGLSPNSDSSNNDIKYKRNFIRTKVLPLLKEVNPNVIDTINSLSEIAQDDNEIISNSIDEILNKISDKNRIKLSKFLALQMSVQKRIIYNIFIKKNLDYDRKKIENILKFIHETKDSKSGKTCSLTNNLWIFVNEKYIEITDKKQENFQNIFINKEGKYEVGNYIFEIEKFSKNVKKFPKDNENIAYVNLENLDFEFELRQRQDGDIIRPFGMKGSQKLKKYLNAKKIPNHQKNNLLFLVQGEEVLWAIGFGISDRIKITSKPTHRLQLYKKEGI